MAVSIQRYTVEEFFDLIRQPENADRHFEYISGEVVEVVSSGYSSKVAALIVHYLVAFAIIENNLGAVTGADGGYMVSGEAYIPDAAFMSHERQQMPEYTEGYNVLAPDLAVEVLSPGNSPRQIATKVVNYLNAGTVVWVAAPEDQTITVYTPRESPLTLTGDDLLTGGNVLEGFSVAVSALFPEQ